MKLNQIYANQPTENYVAWHSHAACSHLSWRIFFRLDHTWRNPFSSFFLSVCPCTPRRRSTRRQTKMNNDNNNNVLGEHSSENFHTYQEQKKNSFLSFLLLRCVFDREASAYNFDAVFRASTEDKRKIIRYAAARCDKVENFRAPCMQAYYTPYYDNNNIKFFWNKREFVVIKVGFRK